MRQVPSLLSDLTAVKAAAMLLVVLDHNDAMRLVMPSVFPALTVHVLAFFFVSYVGVLRNEDTMSNFVRKRLPRYLVPFLVFYVLAAIGQAFLDGWPGWMPFLNGPFLASMAAIKAGCGMAVLWFMPALLIFVLIGKWQVTGPVSVKIALVCSSAVAVLLPHSPMMVQAMSPWGLGAALYALGVCLVTMALLRAMAAWLSNASRLTLAFALLLVCVVGLSVAQSQEGMLIEVGAYDLPGLDDPMAMLRVFATNVLGIGLLVLASPWLGGLRLVQLIGEHSLDIFLMHQFIMVPMLRVAQAQLWAAGHALPLGLVTMALAVAIPIAVARGMRQVAPTVYRLAFNGGR
jgi:Acyltransferase family